MIPELNDFQVTLLKGLARNKKMKTYGACSGCELDRRRDVIDADFASALWLVTLGLLEEVTDISHYKAVCDTYEREGRKLAVLRLTKTGQLMFERGQWENRIN